MYREETPLQLCLQLFTQQQREVKKRQRGGGGKCVVKRNLCWVCKEAMNRE